MSLKLSPTKRQTKRHYNVWKAILSMMGRTSEKNMLVAIISRESQLIQICKGSKEKYDSMIYWYINK